MTTPAGSSLEILVATDAAFALPTAVTLRSLTTSSDLELRIHIVHDAVPAELRTRIEASLDPGDWSLSWHDMSGADSGVLSPHLPRAANFRLVADDLLCNSADRVVYLDVDVLVRGSLAPLATMDMRGRTVAAVRSVHHPSVATWGAIDQWEALGLDPRASFFNSGVLLIDTRRWCDLKVGESSLAYLRSPQARAANADQEALNVVLHKDWLELDPIWNQQTPMLDPQRGAALVFDDAQLAAALSDPHIVHFLSRPKPWHRDCTHPRRDEWRAVAAMTAFAPVKLDRTGWRSEAWRRIRRAASAVVHG